jgi:uncharacterized protein YbaP (TraB family)
MRTPVLFVALAFVLASGLPAARATDPAAADPAVLEEILVSGNQPGPGLWKVSRDGRVMWVLGTLTPVPKRMVWQSEEVESVIASAQEVVLTGGVTVSSGKGFFGSLFLLPSLLSARKNPEKETLREMLPAELHARWLVLKQKYMGRDKAVEKRRPIFAAFELYEKAISKSGLSNRGPVTKLVRRTAKRHKITVTQPLVTIKLEDPKGMIKSFKQSALDDVECFAKTLQHIEQDLETMKDRANAWATGDIELLQQLTYTDQGRACIEAMLGAEALQEGGMKDLPQRVETEWMTAAEKALGKNNVTFAILPMRELVDADGYLAKLAAKGYEVAAPAAP